MYVYLVSAVSCEHDLDVCHFDGDRAFVQSKHDQSVVLRLTKGCCINTIFDKIAWFNNNMYELKEASRSWHANPT